MLQQAHLPALDGEPSAPETLQERQMHQQVRRLEKDVNILEQTLVILSPVTL